MAGPTVGLWLFRARDFDVFRAEVATWLVSFCDPVTAGEDGSLAFRIQDGGALGLPGLDVGDACGFHLYEDNDVLADHDDLSELPRVPVQGLLVDADCSCPVNHRLLGHLALALARRHDAWVDFCGLLGYTNPREEAGVVSKAPALARSRQLVASLPGMARELMYEVGDGRMWSSHVGDAEFLEAWLRHPDFRMVK